MRRGQKAAAQADKHVSRRRRLLSGTVVIALFALPVVVPGSASGDQITDKRAAAQQISAKLDELNARLSGLDEQYNRAQIALATAEAATADAQQRVDATNAELDVRTRELRSFAVQAYMTGNDTPAFEAILTSTADDATTKKNYLESASGSRQDLLDQLGATKEKLAGEVTQLDAAKSEAQNQRDVLASARDSADAAVNEQQQIQSQLQGEIATLVAQDQQQKADAQAAQMKADEAAVARQKAATAAATPTPNDPSPSSGGGSAPSDGAAAAVAAARSALGSPYVWAGAGPNVFDCSGLVMWAWAHGGRSLPHSAAGMYTVTRRIPISDLQPGDLLFYGSPIHHVGIYVGGGQIIHAPHAGAVVEYGPVNLWNELVGAGRV